MKIVFQIRQIWGEKMQMFMNVRPNPMHICLCFDFETVSLYVALGCLGTHRDPPNSASSCITVSGCTLLFVIFETQFHNI